MFDNIKLKNPFVSAIIVAAGNSTRMGGRVSKQFIDLNGKPVIYYTLRAFEKCGFVNEIVVVARSQDIDLIKKLASDFNISKLKAIVPGGETRQQSVLNGIGGTSENSEYFAIHDGARPFVTEKIIEDTLFAATKYKAASTGIKVKDTIKISDDKSFISGTVDRSNLWSVHTPQIFEKELYLSAVKRSTENNMDFTDDCQLVEYIGSKVFLCEGSPLNIKLTTPDDIMIARAIVSEKESAK